MPLVPRQTSVAANATVDVALAPFERFGGGGGRVAVQATVIAASSGLVNMSLLIGSDVVQDAGPIFAEPVVGGGPDANTPAVVGVGAPGDPITIRLSNTSGAAIVVRTIANVQNA